jgi:hypothetical protein
LFYILYFCVLNFVFLTCILMREMHVTLLYAVWIWTV